MNKIELKNISFSYNKGEPVAKHVSFEIQEGSYVSIIGHNGSGKSTLARLMIGLLAPDEGEIYIDGELLTNKSVRKIRQKIGLVFQNPDNQFIGATVEDDIAFGLENRRVPHKDMQSIIENYAKRVGMEEFLTKEPSRLSGGQKQRVAIAGALSLNPEILILDEATSMLDPKGKSTVRKVIDRIHQENPELTIISITHDVDEALLADQVFILSHGKLVKNGKPQEILRDQQALLDLKLDMPFVYRFEKKLSEMGINSKAENMAELVEDIWASK